MPKYYAKLTQIHSGSNATVEKRWSATNFGNKVIMAAPGEKTLYWDGADVARPLPGLPTEEIIWDYVFAFFGHVCLLKENTMRWSDVNDFSTWIPVGETSGTAIVHTTFKFNQPAPGGQTGNVFVLDRPDNWSIGSFVRIDRDPKYAFYSVVSISKFNGSEGLAIPAPVLQVMQPGNNYLWTDDIYNFEVGGYIRTASNKNAFTVVKNSKKIGYFNTVAEDFAFISDNTAKNIKVTDEILNLSVGDFISIAPPESDAIAGQDIYRIQKINLANKTIRIKSMGVGTNRTYHTEGDVIIFQPYIQVNNFNAFNITVPGSAIIIEAYAVVLKSEDTASNIPAGDIISAGSEIQPMEANEAGEYRGSGADLNEAMLAGVVLGETAYILKNRSIQSMQYVGQGQGTFYFRSEITDEGLLGRSTFCKVGNDTLYFIGHKEMYLYQGGVPQPIAGQYTKQMYAEIDINRIDEAFMFHQETNKEVWFVYAPIGSAGGPRKVLIYNYLEQSVVIDWYPEELGSLTTAGSLEWQNDVSWESMSGTWTQAVGSWSEVASYYGSKSSRIDILGVNKKEIATVPTPGDQYWNSVLYLNGGEGGVIGEDEGPQGNDLAVSSVTNTSLQYKYGSKSVRFTESFSRLTDDSLPAAYSNLFSLTGNLTFEAWIRQGSGEGMIFNVTGSTAVLRLEVLNDNTVKFSVTQSGPTLEIISTNTLTNSEFKHVALVKQGAVFKLYINGNIEGSVTSTNPLNETANRLTLGNNYAGSVGNTGSFFDEIRISNMARYTSSFTPPTTAFYRNASGSVEREVPGLLVHGQVYNRLGEAYLSSAETNDFSFEDDSRFKTIDTLKLDLQITNILNPRPFRLYVQFGARDNLDSTIRWTTGDYVEVSGNGNYATKINRRITGRYCRLRFYSDQANIQWKIASYNLMGKYGGTY